MAWSEKRDEYFRYAFQLLSGMPIEVWHPKRHFPWLTSLFIFICATIYPLNAWNAR